MIRFEKLDVYRKSYELALSLYKITDYLPSDERYGIVSQLKRASLSIPLNIAEGYGKQASKAEFNRFLSMAKGSCSEIMVLLHFMMDLGYLKKEDYETYQNRCEEIEKMLYGLIKSARKQ